MKTFILILAALLVFMAGLAFQRYALAVQHTGTGHVIQHVDSMVLPNPYYSNNGIKISGSAVTSVEENQQDEILNGGMYLIEKPSTEVVFAFSEKRELVTEYTEITELYRKAVFSPVIKKMKADEEVWIIGRIKGNATGEPMVWGAQATGTGQFHHSDFFTSGKVYVDLSGPREGANFRSGNYFLLRLVALNVGSHHLEIWPYYHWEGGATRPYQLPTQNRMIIKFDVEK